ncbi:4-hydroxy-tetrahydrodipicolinate synthase [Rhodopseudomonas pseudopalustris]|uniref:4-hydroxy-tetrahydrodipicolinate synthase n=1 Tax=Rhodopseudomonas pseudopalustris TaxID=1513892 RepID=A0A1H8XDB4_9BRAD|nr:4-hydroxy-tetrahydrodipicolinate synthase [Rhodopseudomonas pseudopalustris]SEP37866.1 4-hydroxy-tetrahydrodipicolinate synthase [Rhodopseudomonas pseudopalustris]
MTNPINSSTPWLTGFIADLPTPFDANDRIDWGSFEMLCEQQIRSGARAVLVAETMGEASTLTLTEHDALIGAAVAISCGRVAVIAGAGSNSTSQAIDLTRRAEANGADAVMSVVPYYNKPMQSGIVAHFSAIAQATALPIVLHDAPGRTARELSDETMQRLADIPRFAGAKDATGDIARLVRLRSKLPPDFHLLTGDDSTAGAYLAAGGDGCVSILSNIAPDLCRSIYQYCRQADLVSSRTLAAHLAPLGQAVLPDATPAALKYALCLLGLAAPWVRLPLVELDQSAKMAVAKAVAGVFLSYRGYGGEHRDLIAV